MRLAILSLTFVLSITNLTAQWNKNMIIVSDKITTESRDVSSFNIVDVSEDFEVHIHLTEAAEKVEIEANENLHDVIRVENIGNKLKVYTDSYSSKSRNVEERMVVNIWANQLTEISGNEDVIIVLEDKLVTDKLTINLNEDSTLDGFIEVKNLIVNLNEDSILDIEGSTENMQLRANEDSTVLGFDFTVGDLEVNLNEDSVAKLTVNGNINLRAKEDSYFHYRGEGDFTRKHLSGDSEVRY